MLKSKDNKNKKRYPWRENLSREEVEYLNQFKEDMKQGLKDIEDHKKGKKEFKTLDQFLNEL